ncbi:unnamed protein product, partial [Didymodactylos carnosus]
MPSLAPFLLSSCRLFSLKQSIYRSLLLNHKSLLRTTTVVYQQQSSQQNEQSNPIKSKRRSHYYIFSIAAGALIGTIYALRKVHNHEGALPEYVANSELLERHAMEKRPVPPPITKHVTFDRPPLKEFPYKLTLYQYITCPFSCKVRAYLNYNRIPYDIVEVNSILRREVKWSSYKKVPVVVVEDEKLQLNDSSLILSAIESYFRIPTKTFKDISCLYPPVIEKEKNGKLLFNYPNKYFLTEPIDNARRDPIKYVQREKSRQEVSGIRKFLGGLFSSNKTATDTSTIARSEHGLINVGSGVVGGVKDDSNDLILQNRDDQNSNDQFKLERKWREWIDNTFVHTLSPNIYHTINEAINSFRWFSQAGEWEQIFPWYERFFITYIGAVVMYGVSGKLKRKHNLKPNVRESLYDCANEWIEAVGNKKFL